MIRHSALLVRLLSSSSQPSTSFLRDADPEFGFIQSKELEAHLKEIMAVYDVEVSMCPWLMSVLKLKRLLVC